MDLAFDETQEAIKKLCKGIFAKTVTEDSLKAQESEGRWHHQEAWQALIQSEVLGLAIPEAHGGAGLGLTELCLVLQQIGRHVAPVPFLSSIVMGALPIAEFGTQEQKRSLLPEVIKGSSFLSSALVDTYSKDAYAPASRAETTDQGWVINGEKTCVPDIELASKLLVPVAVGEQIGIFLIDKEALAIEMQTSTNGAPLGQISLESVRVEKDDLLGTIEEGRSILRWMVERAIIGQCALKLGVAERSLFMTAEYTSQRKQFGVPIATFQAVSQRAADAYIDLAAMRVTLWRAVWLLAEGRDARRALNVAKFWSCEAGHRIAISAQHLHGGMGFDRDYALHRYFLWSKHYEFTLGGSNALLEELGSLIASEDGASSL